MTTDLFTAGIPSAIARLNEVISRRGNRVIRLLDLMKEPTSTENQGWAMFCPPCFNDALDIKQTDKMLNGSKHLTWTQGNLFSFKAGDTIYDTPAAYEEWSEAIKKIKVCVSIKIAMDASTVGFSGSVTYDRMHPVRGKLSTIAIKRTSQDEFIRFLITGDDSTHDILSEVHQKKKIG